MGGHEQDRVRRCAHPAGWHLHCRGSDRRMSDFMGDLNRFTAKLENLTQAVFVGTAAEVQSSIVHGSPLTGAPGQPVDTGNLRDSWQLEFPDAEHALVYTDVVYAESNEDGIARPGGGPYVQRSAIGGRWSVAFTRQNIQRIVDDQATKLAGSPCALTCC